MFDKTKISFLHDRARVPELVSFFINPFLIFFFFFFLSDLVPLGAGLPGSEPPTGGSGRKYSHGWPGGRDRRETHGQNLIVSGTR